MIAKMGDAVTLLDYVFRLVKKKKRYEYYVNILHGSVIDYRRQYFCIHVDVSVLFTHV